MKTDRELLELAARSIGIDGVCDENTGDIWRGTGSLSWNPLKFDGDALRLAVKLGISIIFFDGFEEVKAETCALDVEVFEKYSSDVYAATRRAITRAAAQIQLNKEQTNG